MGLLDEIRDGAVDPDVPLTVLLRKCLVLAARLGHKEFKEWVEHELGGYPDEAAIPPYRDNIPCDVKANLAGPFQSMTTNVPVPLAALPEQAQEWANKFRFQQAVAEMESLVREARAGGTTRLESPMPPNLALVVRIFQGHTTVQIWREFGVSQVEGILDRIRNVILEFVLEIEAANPEAGEAPIGSTPVEPERVSQIFNVVVNGQVQSLAVGDAATATAYSANVRPGDFESLREWLRSVGYQEPDINALEQALNLDTESGEDSDGPGPRTQRWLGRMATAAVRGTGSVATGAAGTVLAEVLLRYLGR